MNRIDKEKELETLFRRMLEMAIKKGYKSFGKYNTERSLSPYSIVLECACIRAWLKVSHRVDTPEMKTYSDITDAINAIIIHFEKIPDAK